VHFHGFTAEDRKTSLYNWIDIRVMRNVRGIITVAPQTKERLVGKGIAADRIHVVINAVGDEAFDQVAFTDNPFGSSRPLLVSAGRLSYEKGYDLLLEALGRLKNDGLEPYLLIYGDGPERDKLQAQIERLQLVSRVKLAGFIRDVRPPFGAMDFLVIPSRSEGFPLVLLEAWAQGAPVVATPVGGLSTLIVDNENGMLAGSTEAGALADVLKRALQTGDFKDRCGGAGRSGVEARFTFRRQLEHLEDVYERAAAQ
jgi:glycosyltransferase involved in cell wall biosynthesis